MKFAYGVCASVKGACHELRVATHLMSLGWEVCRNMAPCGMCDIIAYRNGICVTIDVTANATYNPKTYIKYNTKPNSNVHVFAGIDKNHNVTYVLRPGCPVKKFPD